MTELGDRGGLNQIRVRRNTIPLRPRFGKGRNEQWAIVKVLNPRFKYDAMRVGFFRKVIPPKADEKLSRCTMPTCLKRRSAKQSQTGEQFEITHLFIILLQKQFNLKLEKTRKRTIRNRRSYAVVPNDVLIKFRLKQGLPTA